MIVIVIPAKGGSTRLPNKNMALLNGRPMIDYSIDDAQASRRAAAVYVSTDSDAIAAHAAKRGVGVIRRPESLGGDVPILDVYRHALANMPDGDKVAVLVGLQPDHPDRTVTVDETIDRLEKDGADRIMSKEPDGTKSGAHYVLSRAFVDTGESRKDVVIVDDCTNIHFQADLDRAAQRLAARKR
ncbi:cytidylyltransferase domain-containing protein [Ferrovibrio sp.]|uniref:acylneuraminate cytidylyltransferase family protein n=1 Tax=Ferrovibrio sp. TaxID=1917215 RepID=UPI00311EADA3